MPPTVPAGVFWIDDEKLETDLSRRLTAAEHYLPLPAAFQETATVLRALIRSRSREHGSELELLTRLYLTAARENFLLATPEIPGVGSRYEIARSIPRRVWANLPMPYLEIGYRELPLLEPGDCDWMVVAWGEPNRHVSAREYHRKTWEEHVERYVRSTGATEADRT